MVLSEMGCAWVHSRENSGATKVSTQRLVVVSEVLGQYQTYEAMKAAADSYGGINKNAVYLNPQSRLNEIVGGSASGGYNGSGGSQNTGGGTGSVTPGVPKLTISRTGTGTSTVTANGEGVSSGAEIAGGTEVSVSVTPAEGTVPTASLNGNTVTLTESEGVYSGTFQMPSANATLVINSGGATGGGSGDMD
jgi:hypothetical protein